MGLYGKFSKNCIKNYKVLRQNRTVRRYVSGIPYRKGVGCTIVAFESAQLDGDAGVGRTVASGNLAMRVQGRSLFVVLGLRGWTKK